MGCGAAVAQRTVNPLVVGSNPTTPAISYIVDILSQNFQKQVLNAADQAFRNYWQEPEVDPRIIDILNSRGIEKETLIKSFKDQSSSPIKIYFTHLLINLNYLFELFDGEETEELFDFWDNSEFTSLFFDNYDKTDSDILQASEKTIHSITLHFADYYKLNFGDGLDEAYFIKTLSEIGDYENHVYVEDKGCLSLENSLPDNNGFVFINPSPLIISQEETFDDFTFRPGSPDGLSNKGKLLDKLGKALDVLKNITPGLYSTLKSFTHTIIALNEPGMVSFSLQSLPGYSSINLFERDFVDSIDDLIHENGHHYLNHILNAKDLIVEDPEKDYFSPWRMTYRPIRGIYHGTFTFYWALELFGQLTQSDQLPFYFNQGEIEKINFRYVEEFYRLNACREPIKIAEGQELVSDEGLRLINHIFERINEHKTHVEITEKGFSSHLKKNLEDIKRSLLQK